MTTPRAPAAFPVFCGLFGIVGVLQASLQRFGLCELTKRVVMFEVSSYDKFVSRLILLLWSLPEVFLSGFLWQGFATASGYEVTSTEYFFFTGLGGGLGAMFGHILFRFSIVDGVPMLPRRARNKAFANFIAMFLGSATAWQKVANDTRNLNMNFAEAFFFVWFVSFTIFLTTLAVLRGINSLLKYYWKIENDMDTVLQRFYYDVQLSISVSLADAFFVATLSGYYTDNTMGGIFGVNGDTPAFEGMMKSGTAAVLGFTISQLVQNAVVADCWIDRPESQKLPDNKVPLII